MTTRLKFNFFTRSNLFNNIDQEVDTLIVRSKPKKALGVINKIRVQMGGGEGWYFKMTQNVTVGEGGGGIVVKHVLNFNH